MTADSPAPPRDVHSPGAPQRIPARRNPRLAPPIWDHQYFVLSRLRDALRHQIDSAIVLSPGDCVVDLGCGDSPYASWFEDAGCRYLRCDLGGEVDIRVVPGQPLTIAAGSVDGVLSVQVLEHVWDTRWYLEECRRLLRPGGWLLLSTHGTWPYHPHPTDFHRWTVDGLRATVEQAGFRVEDMQGVVGPLAWTTQIRLLGWREVIRRLPLVGTIAMPPLSLLTNLRMTLEDAVTPRAIQQANACVYVVRCRPR